MVEVFCGSRKQETSIVDISCEYQFSAEDRKKLKPFFCLNNSSAPRLVRVDVGNSAFLIPIYFNFAKDEFHQIRDGNHLMYSVHLVNWYKNL